MLFSKYISLYYINLLLQFNRAASPPCAPALLVPFGHPPRPLMRCRRAAAPPVLAPSSATPALLPKKETIGRLLPMQLTSPCSSVGRHRPMP